MTDESTTGLPTPPTGSPAPKRRVSRRAFISGAGLAAGALGLGGGASLHELLTAASQSGEPDPIIPKGAPHLSFLVERETDLVLLEFLFYEFKIDTSSHPRKIVPTSAENLIIVQFPPQAIAEAVYSSENAGKELPVDPAPVLSQVAGRSRLSFTLPKAGEIPLPTMTASDLLSWSGWALNVAGGAQYAATHPVSAPIAPTALQTSVEVPYGMYLSPVVDVATKRTTTSFTTYFHNATEPLSVSNVTSCWSTTLTGDSDGEAVTPQVAAVWSRDYDGGDATPQTEIQY